MNEYYKYEIFKYAIKMAMEHRQVGGFEVGHAGDTYEEQH